MSLTAWALVAAGALTLLLCLYLLAKRIGREEAIREQLEDNADARKDADKRLDRLNKLSDDELVNRM